MVLIYYFSSRSTTGIVTEPLSRFVFFKTLHILEYALLSILLFYGLLRYKKTVIIAYLYALSDEIHQTFVPGRTGLFRDTLFDLLGIIIGLLLIKYLRNRKFFCRLFV